MIFVDFNIITLFDNPMFVVLEDTDTVKINKFVIDSALASPFIEPSLNYLQMHWDLVDLSLFQVKIPCCLT